MQTMHSAVFRMLAVACLILGAGACSRDASGPAEAASNAAGCLPDGDGSLEARLRGALHANLKWTNADMECDGSPHPDGGVLRLTIAGPMPGSTSRLRFIFGIDPHDIASGVAQAYPTNLTLLVEGGQQLYATRGADKCAVETLQRSPLSGSDGKLDRVQVRGYCSDPASDMAGTARVLVSTFSFTALLRSGDEH